METRNAVITDAVIGINSHGILDARITLDYGGSSQVFGDYGLYAFKDGLNREDYTGYFIYRVLEVADAHRWEQLKGRAVRVAGDSARIEAIGHIVADVWFNPGKEFEQLNTDVSA
jgi:hypothetical protein